MNIVGFYNYIKNIVYSYCSSLAHDIDTQSNIQRIEHSTNAELGVLNAADEDIDINADECVQVDDVAAVDNMTVVSRPENDTTWIDNMPVNNDPLNYDFGGEDLGCGDIDESDTEIPLDDDLCNAQLMARSIVPNMQFNDEIFSSSSVENGFEVGMVFKSKAKFLQQLSEWSILYAASFKAIM